MSSISAERRCTATAGIKCARAAGDNAQMPNPHEAASGLAGAAVQFNSQSMTNLAIRSSIMRLRFCAPHIRLLAQVLLTKQGAAGKLNNVVNGALGKNILFTAGEDQMSFAILVGLMPVHMVDATLHVNALIV